MKSLLIRNATVILSAGKLKAGSVLIENGRIEIILPNEMPMYFTADETINLHGARLFAGFIDVHNHGAVGFDVNVADADNLHSIGRFLAKNGITSWLPTLVPDSDENYARVIKAIEIAQNLHDKREPAARILGVHYEGVFANPKMSGALRPQFFKSFSGKELAELPTLQNGVHFTTFAPEIEGGIELASELARQNWIASIGHTNANQSILQAAKNAGARHLTHFFNAMSGLHHRNVGVVGFGLTNEDVTFDIIADKIHVHPKMLEFACRCKGIDKVSLISDCVAPTGLGDGDFNLWGETISVVNGKTQNERGSIAGSVITMLDSVKNMLEIGFTDSQVSNMASLNPAKLLKLDKDFGSIEAGKYADLVALDENNEVVLSMVGGRIV